MDNKKDIIPKIKLKGIFHFHSIFSYDGLNKIDNIIALALKHKLDFLVLTDHDTIRGAIELRKKVESLNLKLIVPIAAEYKTSHGDIIVIGLDREIESLQIETFFKEVRRKNLITILPHPYEGHRNVSYLAENVDIIEVANSRVSKERNSKALKLAKKMKKPIIYASDSHIPTTLTNCVIEIEKNKESDSFLDALMGGSNLLHFQHSSPIDIYLSQLKKFYNLRDYLRMVKLTVLLPFNFFIFLKNNYIGQGTSSY